MTEQEQVTPRRSSRCGLMDSEATLPSWRDHAAQDLVWWNSARGAVDGLEDCLDAIRLFYQTMSVDHVKVPIRSIVSDGRIS